MTEPIFFDTEQSEKKTFEKTRFLNFTLGNHTVRILGAPKRIFTHFLRGKATIKCLGSECPICKNNKALAVEFPDNYTEKSGYNGSTLRYYANVLDKTMVKTCRNCGEETAPNLNGDYLPACPKCQTFLTELEPQKSNKTKVMNISQTNAELINEFVRGTLDADGNQIGIGAFDLVFMVTKANNKKNITPIPDKNANEPVEIPDEFLYDLDKVVIELTPSEIIDLMKGVSLKDIFVARRGSSEAHDVLDEATIASVNESVEALFSN